MTMVVGVIEEFLQSIFEEKYVVDDREPLFNFTIPGYYDLDDGDERPIVFGLFPPSGGLWKQVVALLVLQLVYQLIVATVVYKYVIQKRTSIESYMLGWGVILPLSLYAPYWLIYHFNIQNKVLKLACTGSMGVISFRILPAMYDTSPKFVEDTLENYVGYYSTNVAYIWNDKTRLREALPIRQRLESLGLFVFNFTMYSIVLSIMLYYNFRPFNPNDKVQLEQFHLHTIVDLFRPTHLLNTYSQAVLTYFCLRVSFESNGMAENLKGYATVPIFSNPLFASRTPTEFWTKRWNTMIYNSLKYGVFLPARQVVSSKLAVLLTFLMSGLFHDYIWAVLFYRPSYTLDAETGECNNDGSDDNVNVCLVPIFGKLAAFFFYTGIIMLLERPLSKRQPFVWISNNLPTFVISTMLIILHVPFAHWYMGDWIVGGFFKDYAIGLWHVRPL